ncbi:MAG: class I SAM-dependent methyltransferase [Anaerolineales bacterium]
MSQRSHIEIDGWMARHYDLMMDLLLLGQYQGFMERAIKHMDIQRGDMILVLGSGTGRNICIMTKTLGSTGRIVGVDIGEEMLRQARERCQNYPQVAFLNRRVENTLPFREEFDKAFIAFTLHGFENEDKERVMANVHRALKPGGSFWILDYSEFDLKHQLPPFRWAFRRFECELASEFLSLDLKEMLAFQGFDSFASHAFLWDYVRLLKAEKGRDI